MLIQSTTSRKSLHQKDFDEDAATGANEPSKAEDASTEREEQNSMEKIHAGYMGDYIGGEIHALVHPFTMRQANALQYEGWEKEDRRYFKENEEEEEEEEVMIINRYHGQREMKDWGSMVRTKVVVLSTRTIRLCANIRRGFGRSKKERGSGWKKSKKGEGTEIEVDMQKKRTIALLFLLVLWFGEKGYDGEGPAPVISSFGDMGYEGEGPTLEEEKWNTMEKKPLQEGAALEAEDEELFAALKKNFMWDDDYVWDEEGNTNTQKNRWKTMHL